MRLLWLSLRCLFGFHIRRNRIRVIDGEYKPVCDFCGVELERLGANWKEERRERIAAAVHERWMQAKRSQGITSRKSESGEELMVPYADLSESAKDLDRNSVRAVLDAILAAERGIG